MSTVPDSVGPDLQAASTPPAPAREPEPSGPGASSPAATPRWFLVAALGAALVAGLLSWGIGEAMHGYYGPSKAALRERFDFRALNREQKAADRKNALIAFGTFGALLASALGLAGGLGRRSGMAIAVAMLAGLVLGGLGGGLVAYEMAPIFSGYYDPMNPVLLLPVLVRGGICAVIGLAAGLALGLGYRGPAGAPRALTGGLLGSLLGIIASEAGNASLDPMDRNDQLIPTSMTARLLCYLCVAVGVALGAAILGRGRTEPPANEPVLPP